MKNILTSFAFLGLFTVAAFAHSPLKMTTPAMDATIERAPKTIKLNFAKSVRLTKVTVSLGDTKTRLELPSKKFITEFTIPSSVTGKGLYEINWRALGKDGHALKGAFKFTVSGQ